MRNDDDCPKMVALYSHVETSTIITVVMDLRGPGGSRISEFKPIHHVQLLKLLRDEIGPPITIGGNTWEIVNNMRVVSRRSPDGNPANVILTHFNLYPIDHKPFVFPHLLGLDRLL